MDQRAAFDQVVKPEILNRIALRHRFLSRMTLGFAAGALTVLTFPPLSILLLVPVAYSALFVGLRDLSFGRAFLENKGKTGQRPLHVRLRGVVGDFGFP